MALSPQTMRSQSCNCLPIVSRSAKPSLGSGPTVLMTTASVLHRPFIEAGQHVANSPSAMDLSAYHTIQALTGSIAVRRVNSQEVLFRSGDAGDSIFCVVAGEIELTWDGGGCESFLPGQVFGVGALVSLDHRRAATAAARVDSEIMEMNREEFLFAVQETPMFAVELMASLEQRLRRLQVDDGPTA